MLRTTDVEVPRTLQLTEAAINEVKDKRRVIVEVSRECAILLNSHASTIVFDELKGFDPIPRVYEGAYMPDRDYYAIPVEHPALPIALEGSHLPVIALENLKERITKYQEKENDRTERELLKWVFLPGGEEPPKGNPGEPDGFHSRPATLSG